MLNPVESQNLDLNLDVYFFPSFLEELPKKTKKHLRENKAVGNIFDLGNPLDLGALYHLFGDYKRLTSLFCEIQIIPLDWCLNSPHNAKAKHPWMK